MTLIVVLLGTDHHPFDRVIEWIDRAARRDPARRFVVQHGGTRRPEVAEGHAYLPHARILELLGEASAVVCHGGPGTIMDARGQGHVPICVPRDPAFGEHVDGHQLRFAALAHRAGIVETVDTRDEFDRVLDRVLSEARAGRPRVVCSAATEAARERLSLELDRLVRRSTGTAVSRRGIADGPAPAPVPPLEA